MLVPVSFWVNRNPKRKDKSFLSFRRPDTSLEVSFRIYLNPKRKDKSFLLFRSKH